MLSPNPDEAHQDIQPVADETTVTLDLATHEDASMAEPETPPVEPLLSFAEASQVLNISVWLQAALRSWMTLHDYDDHGHYDLVQWHDFYTATLNHKVV